MNDEIRVPEVRLIDDTGAQRGIVKTSEALREAQEKELDLVEVSANANPPVCRLMNFGKYKYRKEKQQSKQKSKQKKTSQKGIRLSLNMGPHDVATRKKQSQQFLEKGHKLKIEILLRGRERAHSRRAEDIIKEFALSLDENIVIEQEISRQQNAINMIVRKK